MASDQGYSMSIGGGEASYIRICPRCTGPTFFPLTGEGRFLDALSGRSVGHVPEDVATLYTEARRAIAAGAPTAAVLACRKVLMHVAVERGATPGTTFVKFVEYLDAEGYIPTGAKGWVDYIRSKSNEANHEIVVVGRLDASALLGFVEMLLRVIYELPGQVPHEGE